MSTVPPGMTKEKHRAMSRLDAHFKAEKPDWDAFLKNVRRKSFVRALQADPRANDALKRHAGQMHELHAGTKVKTVGKYDVTRKKDGSLACTCPDWRYRRSIAFGEAQDCKHIRAYKEGQKKEAAMTPIIGGALAGGALGAMREHALQRPERDAYQLHADLGTIGPEVQEARARGRLGKLLAAGAKGAVLGGGAVYAGQRLLPEAVAGVRGAASTLGRDFGQSATAGVRNDFSSNPPKGRMWRMFFGGLGGAKA